MPNDGSMKKGAEIIEKLFGQPPRSGAMHKDFFEITQGNLFGDIWGRPGLALEERSMITIAALAVLGREPELNIHLNCARNLGIPREKVEEIMIHLAHYGGWPVGVSGLRKVEEIYGKE